jgi:hypothetical protein
VPLADRYLRIKRHPHSGEVLARGGDTEAHSVLQRSGFINIRRPHDSYHRLPKGLTARGEARQAAAAVCLLTSLGYHVDHDPAFAPGPHAPYGVTLGNQVSHLAERITGAVHSEDVTEALTELTTGDGILPATASVLTAAATFLQDLGQGSDYHRAQQLHHLADQLSALTAEVHQIRNHLADRHTPHPHRRGPAPTSPRTKPRHR